MKFDIDSLTFRKLHADEIEIRVGNVINGKKFKGCTLLLYQDARCAMDILDETVGCNNWQRDHKEVKGNMYCGISIWDEEKELWVTKWDCGVESNTEKEKGESSDSFKRAAVNWGIGRELYSAPNIMVACDIKPKDNGKGYELADKYMFSGAKVSHILYEDGEIAELIIVDKDGVVISDYPKGLGSKTMTTKKPSAKKTQPKQEEPKEAPRQEFTPSDMVTAEEAGFMKQKLAELKYDTATFLEYVGQKTKGTILSVDGMTKAEYVYGMRVLEAMERRDRQ